MLADSIVWDWKSHQLTHSLRSSPGDAPARARFSVFVSRRTAGRHGAATNAPPRTAVGLLGPIKRRTNLSSLSVRRCPWAKPRAVNGTSCLDGDRVKRRVRAAPDDCSLCGRCDAAGKSAAPYRVVATPTAISPLK